MGVHDPQGRGQFGSLWELMPLGHDQFGSHGFDWQDLCRGPLNFATY